MTDLKDLMKRRSLRTYDGRLLSDDDRECAFR